MTATKQQQNNTNRKIKTNNVVKDPNKEQKNIYAKENESKELSWPK